MDLINRSQQEKREENKMCNDEEGCEHGFEVWQAELNVKHNASTYHHRSFVV
jgi:hypothetical protein